MVWLELQGVGCGAGDPPSVMVIYVFHFTYQIFSFLFCSFSFACSWLSFFVSIYLTLAEIYSE